ncbi:MULTISPECIES: hypothetical protein [unclassified Microbacterium]|uniref:hypothetical protein n=1 Tax=unclassified Microbacterium TaxID=2609290 RepID=UPI00214B8B1A|nr:MULTISPECIES: hypothetical protein [unclassified Microbacterium]MCR2785437.1 hypothetical protein [Microbacterium sp. zg.B96]WIM14536.1 hypothetical protein QNO11_08075 [Microbacterium sp. zg-B96]
MGVRLDVMKSPQLMATILALRSVDKNIQKNVRDQTKRVAQPEWKKALAERANTRLEQRVLVDTAVVSVSNQNVRIQSAQKGRPLSGGLNPKTHYPPVEFGMKSKKATYDRRSPKGKTHKVTRTVGTQFKAPRREGPFWLSAREMVPRMARLWVQTTVRTIAEALEGKE